MTGHVADLSDGVLEKFCIDELILNTVRIRCCLSSLRESGNVSGSLNFEALLAKLEELEVSTNAIVRDLTGNAVNVPTAQPAVTAPLELVNPIAEPSKFRIENVISKFPGRTPVDQT